MKVTILLPILLVFNLFLQSQSWLFIKRRRRSCSPSNCRVSSWSSWSTCSRSCGSGTQGRARVKTVGESCGGSCSYKLQETRVCNTNCCPVNCVYSWGSWSACKGCGKSTQSRSPSIRVRPSCGGRSCPGKQTRSCDTGQCCPVNCVVNSWGSWGACNAACEQTGKQTRTRTVRTQPSCKGTACPTLVETKSCKGGCCRRDCLVSSWSAWGKCNAPPGKCSANAGTRSRSRSITRQPSCGGSACPSLSQSGQCTPVPISCLVSSWSSFTKCTPNSGSCGPGTQYRTRKITRNPYCSSPCPSLKETQSCSAGCCPVNCAVSSWSSWSSCTSTCGTGTKTRTRRITTNPSCNGQACPTLKSTTSCSQYNNKDCVMSAWSSWSQCSNGCGNGMVTKTRRITTQPVCQGKKCGPPSASKVCTSYRDNRDCKVGSWTSWGSCSTKCAVGSRQRTRSITVSQRCRGTQCPTLKETSQCGTANGGCQHLCSNNVCSCRPGYNLGSDRKTCIAKNCGTAQPSFCVQGTKLGSTCKYAIVTCPGGKTTYPVTCSLGCPKYYSLKGISTITCQTSGRWTSYSSTYCRRNNDPPTQILLSGSSSVAENQPRGTKIGTFSSIDPVNSKDTHTYTIIKGGSGLFEIKGKDLLTLKSFNYESSPNSFDITIRSTDNGVPAFYLDKTFTIKVTDVNEAPTDIQLSSTSVDENSDVDTTVGMLSTADPDKSQSFTYLLLDNAGGRFKVVNNFIKVAQSNRLCLQSGGSKCLLNYEQQKSHVIKVRSTDSGSPSKSIQITFFITINDVNDRPRDLKLSNNTIKENAPIDTVIGQFISRDEDTNQQLVYSLIYDDKGRFKIDNSGQLLKAKDTDYETSKVHSIEARVTDNGSPALNMSKKFSIIVLNENDAPVSLTLDKTAVKENSVWGTQVATVTAIDTDAVQRLTFSLDDDAGGKFALSNQSTCQHRSQNDTLCTTTLVVSGDLDYEDAQSEIITIRVTDNQRKFISNNMNITIIDENDKPTNLTLEGSLTATVFENSRDIEIGELQTEDQDFGQTYTYTLLSNGNGNFEVRGNKLYITKSANLNYEIKTSYHLSVRSTDSGNPQYSIENTLIMYLKDLNEAPTDITLSNATVVENTPTGTLIGKLSITDPDNLGPQGSHQSHTCRLTDSANGMIGISMSNNENQLTVGTAGVNFEAKSIVGIVVECTDPNGLLVQKAFNITVLDVNEAPNKIVISNLNVKENQKTPTILGDVTVTDPDNLKTQHQTFTFYAYIPQSGPPGTPGLQVPFDVRNGKLVAMAKLDFESKPLWSFSLRVTDNGTPSLSKTEQISVQVLDTNDRPTNVQISNAFLDENSAQDTVIGALSTTDEDTTQSHTYLCVDCANGRFKIQNNELRVAQSNQACLAQGGAQCKLNYETAKKYPVKIQSTDDGTPPYNVNITLDIILRDVNDQPRDLKLSNNKVTENATINTLIGQFSARDEDVKQSLTFSLVNDDNGRFKVSVSGNLYKAKETNYEIQKTHSIRAVATDNGSPVMKVEKTFIIEVLNINEPPVSVEITSTNGQVSFPKNSPRVKENSPLSTSIGTLVALDADANQTITFKLDDDASGKFVLFSKSSCSSVTNIPGYNTKCTTLLKLNGKLNYEQTQSYSIIVRVTDNHGPFKTQKLTVDVIDLNEKPTNISLSALSVNENANGALVGVLTTTDEDLKQSYIYKLTNDASGKFEIQGEKLFVSSNANLDFEAQSQYKISIQVQDSGSPPLSFTKGFSITVNDINEAPTSFNLSNYHVTENSIRDTVIGSFSVNDPDNLGPQGTVQTHFCSVIGSQVGQFVVQKNVLKIGSAVVNYEQASFVDVQVRCSDNGKPSLSLSKTVRVIVDDVNETPKNISLSSNSIAENSPPSLVGTLSTNDLDNEFTARQTFTYRIVGAANGFPFVINGSDLRTTRSLDFEKKNSWTITIQSTDSGKPPKNVINTFTISVVDINELPTLVSFSKSTVQENSDKDTLIGVLSTQDPDSSQKHTYTLLDTASGRFKIEQNKLKVAVSNVECLKYGGSFCRLNYENQRQHIIRVRSTDNGVPPLNKEQTFTINVTDVNDRPRLVGLSGYSVLENATTGTKIGLFSGRDEDAGQVLSFSLLDDDNGRFIIDKQNYLVKAKSTDYETNKKHVVTVQVKDNGSPPLALTKNITISVLDINEAPINTTITSTGGQQTYPDNYPRINENSPKGTIVGTIMSLDRDEVQVLNFTLVDDALGKFTVSRVVKCQNLTNIPGVKTKCSAPLYVNDILNYEQSSSEVIIVKVTDPKGSSHSQTFTIKVLNVNDRPNDVTLSGGYIGYVDENANNALVGDLAASDEDAGQTHTYRLINNGGWKFVIRGRKVYTSMYANLNYEKKSTYTIKVRAIDDGRPKLFIDKAFTIKINDVNEQPINILLSNYSVPENSPRGVPVGKISVIDPDNLGPKGHWQGHNCTIVNNVPFIVNQSTSDLVVAGTLNHEATPTIDVILRCYDNGSKPLYLEKKFTVQITDINEAPTTISLSDSTIAENSGILTVGKFTTIDPDNLMSNIQTFTYSLVGDSGLPFAVDGDSLNTTRSLDYEAKSTWNITVMSTDNKGLSVKKNFVVAVSDRNDVPSGLNATGPFTCYENSVLGTYLGTVCTIDEDAGQTFTYSINSVLAVGHLGHKRNDSSVLNVFSIDPSTGVVTLSSALNFEQYTKYTLSIRSIDSGTPPLSVMGLVDVTIQDINEAPNNITLSSNTVSENAPADTVVGNLTVHDPDNAVRPWQQFSCHVTNPFLAPFKVVNHLVLEVAEDVLNYEARDTYVVGIYCSEVNGTNYNISTTFTINLIDVNESPYNLTLSNATISENNVPGYVVGTINVLDPDTPGSSFGNVTVTILTQTPSDAFKIDGRNLVATKSLDYERVNTYQVTMVAQDSGIPPLEIQTRFDIHVLDVNDPPSKLTLTSSGIYENATVGTVVGTLTAVDEDKGQKCAFTVVSPSDLFSVSGNKLLLKSATLNYESTPAINVSINVTDDGNPSKTSQLVVAVKVLDCNDPPSDVTVAPLQPMVQENSPGGTLVANLTVLDQDISQNHICVLQDGSKWFETKMVSTSTAQVLVKTNADLDYEAMNDTTVTLTILCTDSGSPPYSERKSFSVVVTDVNEPPYNITLSGSHTVEEHAPRGTVVGGLSCEDEDLDQSHVFTVTGTSSKIFGVDPSTSVLYVKDPSLLDYESSTTITISILAKDNATKPLQTSRDFVLRIIDVNEAPIFVRAANKSVREDVPIGSCLAKIQTKDPDPGQNVALTLLSHRDTFTLSNTCPNTSTDASTNTSTGTLRFLTSKAELSYDNTYPTHVYAVLIEAKDDGTPPMSFNETFFVPINRVNPCDTKDDCNGNTTCVRVNGTAHTCRCNPGFTGNGWSCREIDECSSNPCLYKSDICKNKEDNPCQGHCRDFINNYTCTCPRGFTGRSGCYPIDYCASNPCMNNATCELDVFEATFKCYCIAGFNGYNCSINIDECQPHNCYNHGDCTDGVNRFDCSCYEGYKGTKCQRKVDDCKKVECASDEVCVLPDISLEEENEEQKLCFDKDFLLPIFFKPSVFTLNEVNASHWQYLFQSFVFKKMKFKEGVVIKKEDATNLVRATDLIVMETSTLSLYPLSDKRVRKSTGEKIPFTAVDFVIKYKTYGVPRDTFYLSLKDACKYSDVDGSFTDFDKKICSSGMDMITRFHIKQSKPSTGAREKDNTSIFGLHPYMYYVFAGVGGMLLLLLIIGIALYRRNVNQKRQDRAFRTHHELLDNDNLATDVMQRHQLSNEGQGEGAFNPMYGVSSLDAQPSFSVSDNPIYSRPDEERENTEGFSNPMYESFKPGDNGDNSNSDQPLKAEENAESIYQIPKSTNEKKKKKKKTKKKKGKVNDGDDEVPDVASVNPMFASREIYNDSENEDDRLYGSTEGKHDDAVMSDLYAVPKRKQADDVTTPLREPGNQSGIANIYDTPRNALGVTTTNPDEPEEPVPSDIVSAFSFSAAQTIDGASGQTDC